jgi:hypothetical protein
MRYGHGRAPNKPSGRARYARLHGVLPFDGVVNFALQQRIPTISPYVFRLITSSGADERPIWLGPLTHVAQWI